MNTVIERSKLDVGLDKFTECEHKRINQADPDCIHCNMAWALERIKILEFSQQKKEYNNDDLITKLCDVSPGIIGSFLARRISWMLREEGYCRIPTPDEFKSHLAAILLKYQRAGLFDNILDKYNPKLLTGMSQDLLEDLNK